MSHSFTLSVNGISRTVYPKYENAEIQKVSEEGRKLKRAQWIELTFQGIDFEFINNGTLNYEYTITYSETLNGITTFTLVGKFTKSDCKISFDEKSLTITPTTKDQYTKVIEYLNKERNIVAEIPKVSSVVYDKHPILQIYVSGSDYITNILGGQYWTQQTSIVIAPSSSQITAIDPNDYEFGEPVLKVFISGVGEGLSPDVTGAYEDVYLANGANVFKKGDYQIISYGVFYDSPISYFIVGNDLDQYHGFVSLDLDSSTLDDDDFNSVWSDGFGNTLSFIGYHAETDRYGFRYHGTYDSAGLAATTLTHVSGATHTGNQTINEVFFFGVTAEGGYYYRWTIYDTNTSEYIYLAPVNVALTEIPTYSKGATFTSRSTGDQVKCLVNLIYARMITGLGTLYSDEIPITGAVTVNELPEEDIVPTNNNYRYGIGINLSDADFEVSDLHSTEIGSYGVFSEDALHFENQYFVRPNSNQIPININGWTEQSLWFTHSDLTNSFFIDDNVEQITLRHAYSLKTVIDKLVQLADENASHTESDFLYGLSNAIRGTQRDVYITPKSNIVNSNYDQPASIGNLSLREVLEMIKVVYNMYWHMTPDKSLVIEHLNYYERGRRYTGQNIGLNTSNILNPRTGKTIRNAVVDYEKFNLPEFLNFSWMDDVSDYFKGGEVRHLDNYIDKGAQTELAASKFTSDIAFMLVNAAGISLDGFAILETNFNGEVNKVVYDGNVQNGYLAFAYLISNYHTYGMSCTNVSIDGTETEATTVKRAKRQEVFIPNTQFVDENRLITTELGTGEIKSISRKIADYETKIEVLHETES